MHTHLGEPFYKSCTELRITSVFKTHIEMTSTNQQILPVFSLHVQAEVRVLDHKILMAAAQSKPGTSEIRIIKFNNVYIYM